MVRIRRVPRLGQITEKIIEVKIEMHNIVLLIDELDRRDSSV